MLTIINPRHYLLDNTNYTDPKDVKKFAKRWEIGGVGNGKNGKTMVYNGK